MGLRRRANDEPTARLTTDGCLCFLVRVERMSDAGSTSGDGRTRAVQDWLSRRADTRLGRLALQWFRAYFEASRNSGCAATVYSSLSVLPAALVAVAYFHSSGSDTNAFAERLITHLKLNG